MRRLFSFLVLLSIVVAPAFVSSNHMLQIEAQEGCYVGSTFTTPCPNSGGSGTNLICKIFPFLAQADAFNIKAICGNVNSNEVGGSINSTITLITTLIFIVIILFAVFVIVKAAIKYIRSEGDDTKIQEAQKAIKSVFVGIAALFIGVIGIIIVLAFFNVGEAIDRNQVNGTNQVDDNPLLNSILN